MKVRVCKYCGKKFPDKGRGNVCNQCQYKHKGMSRFAKARDDLRELLGLERMGSKNG